MADEFELGLGECGEMEYVVWCEEEQYYCQRVYDVEHSLCDLDLRQALCHTTYVSSKRPSGESFPNQAGSA